MKTIALAALAAALAACSGPRARLDAGRVPDVLDERPDARGYFEAVGIGAADASLPTLTQRRAVARDAAIVAAQYELASMLDGVELSGGVKVSKAVETDSNLSADIHAAIRGAQVLKSEFTTDGGCVVTLRLPKSRLLAAGVALK